MRQKILLGSLAAVVFGPALPGVDLGGVDIHGFASQGYLRSSGNEYISGSSTDGTFEYNEVGLTLSTQIDDRLRVGLQLFSRDLGEWGNNDLGVDWAYGDYYLVDEFSLRAGKVKSPKGIYQEIQDFDFLRVWAILPASVYDPSYRAFGSALYGAQGYGTFDFDGGGALSYQLTIGDSDLSDNGDLERLITNSVLTSLDDADADFFASIHLDYETPLDGLRVVATVINAQGMEGSMSGTLAVGPGIPLRADFTFDRFIEITFGSEYVWESWTFTAEYRRLIQDLDIVQIVNPGAPSETRSSAEINTESDGGYLGIGYRLDEHWSFGGYVSAYWDDVDDRDGEDESEYDNDYEAWRYELALSVRYDVNQHWLIKAEAHFASGAAGTSTYNEDDDELEEDWQYFALKTTFNF